MQVLQSSVVLGYFISPEACRQVGNLSWSNPGDALTGRLATATSMFMLHPGTKGQHHHSVASIIALLAVW